MIRLKWVSVGHRLHSNASLLLLLNDPSSSQNQFIWSQWGLWQWSLFFSTLSKCDWVWHIIPHATAMAQSWSLWQGNVKQLAKTSIDILKSTSSEDLINMALFFRLIWYCWSLENIKDIYVCITNSNLSLLYICIIAEEECIDLDLF